MKTQLSVRAKLLVTIVLPLVALLIVSFLSVRIMSDIEAGVDRIYQDRVVPLRQLKTIADDYAVAVIDAVNKADNGMMSAEQALAGVREARDDIAEHWNTFLATELTTREARLADEARGLFRAANADLDQLESALSGMSGNVAGQLSAFNGPLYDSIDPISDKITELVDLQIEVASQEASAIASLYDRSLMLFAGVVLVAFVLVLAAGWWTYASVAVPINRMRETMTSIAEHRDLSQRVDTASDDEIGRTAAALNTMLDQFAKTIGELRGMTDQMASAAEELSAVSTQTNSNLDNQRSQTEQVSTAMNEMTATVQEVARNASDVASSSQEADHESREGSKVVQSVVSDIGSLSAEVGQIADTVHTLDEQSQQIGSVLDVIRGIAEQTNLLALNAAIEAARAGEQGRGFAVVADEVRTLASRTQNSTSEIQAMIERLQDRARAASEVMNQSHEQARASVDQARRAAESLTHITEGIARIRDMSNQIAAAVEEQGTAGGEINRGVETIRSAADTTATRAGDSHGAARSVSELAAGLQNLSRQFWEQRRQG